MNDIIMKVLYTCHFLLYEVDNTKATLAANISREMISYQTSLDAKILLW